MASDTDDSWQGDACGEQPAGSFSLPAPVTSCINGGELKRRAVGSLEKPRRGGKTESRTAWRDVNLSNF